MMTRDGNPMFTCFDPQGNVSVVIEENHDQGEAGQGDTGE
jgi:hypothetical protein